MRMCGEAAIEHCSLVEMTCERGKERETPMSPLPDAYFNQKVAYPVEIGVEHEQK